MIARDVVTDGLQAKSVGVYLLIACRRLRRDRAQVTAVAERTVGEVITVERDLARMPERAHRRVRAKGHRTGRERDQKCDDPDLQEELSLTAHNFVR